MSKAISAGRPAPRQRTAEEVLAETMKYRWIILLGLLTAAIMEVLDSTIVNVALPQMAGNLGATTQEIAWVSTGYILANVVFLPLTAWLTTVFGRKNYLATSTGIFIVASFFCGTSHSLNELIIWRILQGAGGAALLSTAQATLRQIFPKNEQTTVQTLFLLGIIVAPTLGPTLGGWITDNYTWNWCFFINVPIGLVSMFLIVNYLQDPPGMRNRHVKVDALGIGLLAVGLSCLQYVLEEGQQDDWFGSVLILRLTIVSVICLVSALIWLLAPANKSPVLDLRILKNRTLAASIFLFVSLGFGLYGGTYLFPLFSQQLLGFTATTSGLALLPGGLATAAAAMICGRLLSLKGSPVDARVLIFIGVAIFCSSMWTLSNLNSGAGFDETRHALLIRGLALGFLFTPINNAAFGDIDPRQAQQASSLINLARQLGGSFGIAALGTYLYNHTQIHRAYLIDHVYSGNPELASRQAGIANNLVAHGIAPSLAQGASIAQIDQALMRQASMLAYNDSWKIILLAFVLASPAIFLLRKPKPSAAPVDAH